MTQIEPDKYDIQLMTDHILQLLHSGNFKAAEISCRAALKQGTGHNRLWFYLGVACLEQQKYDAALDAFMQAQATNSQSADVWNGLATVHSALGNYTQALEAVRQACQLSPASAESLANMAIAYEQLGEAENAVDYYQKALEINPVQTNALLNLAALLVKLKRMKEASAHCEQAITMLPFLIGLYNNYAEASIHLFDFDKALHICDSALQIEPRNAVMHFKRGLVLSYLQKVDDARAAFIKAQLLQPDIIIEYFPKELNDMASVQQVGEPVMDPQLIYLAAGYQKQAVCYWQQRQAFVDALKAYIVDSPVNKRSEPFPFLIFYTFALPISPKTRLQIARRASERIQTQLWLTGKIMQPQRREQPIKTRIKIGYISPDFRQHPTAVLSRQIYGLHDRSKFEVIAYSLHKDVDPLTEDIMEQCDAYKQIEKLDSFEIANMIREDGIDILVDLAGYTKHSRTEVLALRPAPVQISYLGFVNSMGADFIDYAMVDTVISPAIYESDWHEKLLRLPHCLYTYDNQLSNVGSNKIRSEYGLPENAIVFCCLNANYKIEPMIFSVWMNILKAVPESVIWLFSLCDDLKENLQSEAIACGVDESRLVFAGHMKMEEHLKRYQMADIFLDTYWCNAHTTAIDALWQGLPVLTCPGQGSPSRVAASFLTALEMPELIVNTIDEYEARAIYYATHPEVLLEVREKLKAKRFTAPLFNTEMTVRHIERAYEMAWTHYKNGLSPTSMNIPAISDQSIQTDHMAHNLNTNEQLH